MKEKLKGMVYWARKVAVYLAFFGILTAKEAQAYGLPPIITVPPLGLSVQNGGTATFTATIGVSLTPLTIRWYRNGSELKNAKVSNVSVPLLGTTVSTLTISNVSSGQAGNYYIEVENSGGSATSGNALLVVVDASSLLTNVSLLSSQCGMSNGGFHLQLLKPANSNCVVEASTDFINWVPIYTNTSGSTNISCLDTAATNLLRRYYRARLR